VEDRRRIEMALCRSNDGGPPGNASVMLEVEPLVYRRT
jgi:hypothetical protein